MADNTDKQVIAGEWWDNDKHCLDRVATRVCNCPYHQKLRDDNETDRREQAEMEGEYGDE